MRKVARLIPIHDKTAPSCNFEYRCPLHIAAQQNDTPIAAIIGCVTQSGRVLDSASVKRKDVEALRLAMDRMYLKLQALQVT
jgi:hypothetical protein